MVKCRGAFLFLVIPALLFNTFVFRCFFLFCFSSITVFNRFCLVFTPPKWQPQSVLSMLTTPTLNWPTVVVLSLPSPLACHACFFFRALTLSETGLKWFSGVRFFPFSSHQLFRSRGRTREAQIDRGVRTSLQQWQYFFFLFLQSVARWVFRDFFLVSRCVASIQNRVRDPIRHSALSE